MAGADETLGGKQTLCAFTDENNTDQRSGGENEEILNIEDGARADQAIGEEGQPAASDRDTAPMPMDDHDDDLTCHDDDHDDDDDDHDDHHDDQLQVQDDDQQDEDQLQVEPATNGSMLSNNTDAENENDIDVADVELEGSILPEEPETGLLEEETELQGEAEQSLDQTPTSELNDRLFRLPLTRIKHIMKMDPDVTLASQEAVVTIAKAAEMFIGALSRDASYRTIQGRRRIVLRKDLEHIMDTRDCYAFLEGAVDS